MGHAAAREGRRAAERWGCMPCDLEQAARWAYARLGVWVSVRADLPVNGIAYPAPIPELRGAVVLRPGDESWRWALAHELGHLMLGTLGQVRLQLDCRDLFWRRVPAERAANEWAAMFLLPIDDLTAMWRAEWSRSAIALSCGIPPAAVDLRVELSRALREWEPNRLAASQVRLVVGEADGGC